MVACGDGDENYAMATIEECQHAESMLVIALCVPTS